MCIGNRLVIKVHLSIQQKHFYYADDSFYGKIKKY